MCGFETHLSTAVGIHVFFLMHFVGNLESLQEHGEEPQITHFVASQRQLLLLLPGLQRRFN